MRPLPRFFSFFLSSKNSSSRGGANFPNRSKFSRRRKAILIEREREREWTIDERIEEGERERRGGYREGTIPGADTGVITNKFSTRNEARKRERVNPRVQRKGLEG